MDYFADSEELFELLQDKWNVLEEIEKVLHVPYLTTMMLQNKDFTLSDFFGCVKIIEMKLRQIIEKNSPSYTNFAENLLQKIAERKNMMLGNRLMLCALYLDPRYKCEIDQNDDKMRLVKQTLSLIWDRVKLIRNGARPDDIAHNISNESDEQPENMNKYFDELDQHYSEMGLQTAAANDSHTSGINTDLIMAFNAYDSAVFERAKSSESVHNYWEKNKLSFGTPLYELSSIIFAIPPTQASVERCFSALKFMLTDRRYNLAEELLESLLTIHLNQDEFYLVRDAELNAQAAAHK